MRYVTLPYNLGTLVYFIAPRDTSEPHELEGVIAPFQIGVGIVKGYEVNESGEYVLVKDGPVVRSIPLTDVYDLTLDFAKNIVADRLWRAAEAWREARDRANQALVAANS